MEKIDIRKKIGKNIYQNYDDKKLDYKALTVNQIEAELNRESYKEKYFKLLKSTIYTLVIVAAVATLIATLMMPVLKISGSSMYPTFKEGEIVVSLKTKNLQTGDVVAFYHGNKILVKRVIAGAGKWINITEDGTVYIDGMILKETYVNDFALGESNIEFPYQVPDGHWFVLGDKRSISVDSRNSEIGSVSQEEIVGKILFRVWPLNKFGGI